jgi:hypothetical protein
MENWKHIDGFESYMVSDQGNVKSLNFRNTGKERLLSKIFNTGTGYYLVYLYKEGKRLIIKIHQLVWITFKGEYRTGSTRGLMLNHISKDKLDNRLTNLELVTNTQNVNHSMDKSKTSSKYPNVCWHGPTNKWISKGTIGNNRNGYVGLFETEEEAYEAFKRAKREAENIYN